MHHPISSWPKLERPREKLFNNGVGSLSDAELFAILIGTGGKNSSALSLAYQLVNEIKVLKDLGNITYKQIASVSGLGPAKVSRILAALEIGRRRQLLVQPERLTVNRPEQAVALLKPLLQDAHQEKFVILLLDNKYRLIKNEIISVGSLDQTLVHPRDVFRAAFEVSAAALILGHNHTSGDPRPSKQDISLTKSLIKAAKMMQLSILDHVIIGEECYLSMKQEGVGFTKEEERDIERN